MSQVKTVDFLCSDAIKLIFTHLHYIFFNFNLIVSFRFSFLPPLRVTSPDLRCLLPPHSDAPTVHPHWKQQNAPVLLKTCCTS